MAVVALLAVAVIAYFAVDRMSPGPNAVAGVKGSGSADAGKAATPAAGAAKAAPPVVVEVIQVKPSTVQEDLQAVGSLQSNESVILRPEVPGRIAVIGFKDGQTVRKGQLLIALDNTLNDAEVAQMKAEYDLAVSNLKRSEDLARAKVHQLERTGHRSLKRAGGRSEVEAGAGAVVEDAHRRAL